MYTKQDYEDLQSINYVYYECESVVYTLDKKYRILREIVGTKETFMLQTFLPEKWGRTMPTLDRETWGIVRCAGYFYVYDEHKNIIKHRTIEDALQVIS